MQELNRQVVRARRRLTAQRWFAAVVWGWSAGLSVSLVAVLVDKYRPLGLEMWAWPALGLAVGTLAAAAWTLATRATMLDAACEMDRRFGLKERVASALFLSTADQQSPAGQALVADSTARVERLLVSEQFRVRPSRWSWVPLVPALAVFLVATLFQPSRQSQVTAHTASEPAQVKKSTEKLREKLEARRKQLEKAGLKEAEELVSKLEQGTTELGKTSDIQKKDTLVKLNNLSQDLNKRREQLGGAERLKQQLNQMRGFERGPADRMAQAMRQGDYRRALDEVKKLQEQLQRGELDQAAKEQLTKQLAQMEEKLKKLTEGERQERKALEEKIAQKRAEGKQSEADELQRKLDQMAQREKQLSQLEKMASQIGECKKSLEKGDAAEAAAKLGGMRTELADLAQQMDELEMLEGALDELAEAKESMGCQECEGEGCAACRGRARGQFAGRGMGEGRGEGERPEERTDTGNYDTQVRQKVGPGASVVTGLIEGPNVKGQVQAEIAAEFEAAKSDPNDPLTDQPLPSDVRDHARDYFESLREGE